MRRKNHDPKRPYRIENVMIPRYVLTRDHMPACRMPPAANEKNMALHGPMVSAIEPAPMRPRPMPALSTMMGPAVRSELPACVGSDLAV